MFYVASCMEIYISSTHSLYPTFNIYMYDMIGGFLYLSPFLMLLSMSFNFNFCDMGHGYSLFVNLSLSYYFNWSYFYFTLWC